MVPAANAEGMKVKGMDVAYGSPSITYGKSQGGPQAYSRLALTGQKGNLS